MTLQKNITVNRVNRFAFIPGPFDNSIRSFSSDGIDYELWRVQFGASVEYRAVDISDKWPSGRFKYWYTV